VAAAFEAASRLQSFTRAAEELNLTQAAVSRQIHVLEKYLGIRLFDRRRHDVILTVDGMLFAAKVNPALIAIGDAAATLKSGVQDELTMRTEFGLATHWLMPRLSHFQLLNPGLSIRVMTSSRPIETETERFDIGLGHGLHHGPGLRCEALGIEVMVPVCSPATRRRLPPQCSANDLADFDLIHFDQRGAEWLDWERYLNRFGVTSIGAPRLVLSVYNSVIDAALQGYGVALGYRYTIDALLKDGRLVEIEDMAVEYPDPLSAQTPTNRKPAAAVGKFIAWVKDQLAKAEGGRYGKTI
jgi:LysR family glycine cleavage system transcriptional activator